MNDLKTSVKRKMVKGFKTVYKSSLKPFIYERNLESYTDNPNNDPDAGVPYFDPVSETWIYPTSETPDNTSETLKGLIRSAGRDTYTDPSLLATDIKITTLYDDFIAVFTSLPETSDKVEYNGKEYRVKKATVDSVDCFIHIFIRGI